MLEKINAIVLKAHEVGLQLRAVMHEQYTWVVKIEDFGD